MTRTIGDSRICVAAICALIFPAILSGMRCMLVHVTQSCQGFPARA